MKNLLVVFGLISFAGIATELAAQKPPADGPRYVNRTNLVRPEDYREWVFLSSGLDMNYNAAPGAQPSQTHTFTNVFVNPSSYRSFMQTGKWPDKTIFVLEGRSAGPVSKFFPENKAGQFQTTMTGIEANVKDSQFADGWAFYNFPGAQTSVAPLSGDALTRGQCVECHTKEAAVERTFVQFYPTLLDVARRKGTLKPGF